MRKTKYPYGIFVRHDSFIQSGGIPLVRLCSSSAWSWKLSYSCFFSLQQGCMHCLPQGKSFLRLGITSYKAQHNEFVKMRTPQKHLVVEALSCIETSTWFGSIASAGNLCPNLTHITWSAPGKFIVKEDGTTKKVSGCCTYYGNRLQVLKEKLLPWSSRKARSFSSDLYCPS